MKKELLKLNKAELITKYIKLKNITKQATDIFSEKETLLIRELKKQSIKLDELSKQKAHTTETFNELFNGKMNTSGESETEMLARVNRRIRVMKELIRIYAAK